MLLAAAPAGAAGLGITLTTTPDGGPYAPRNVGAIWIEDAGGNFVKTIDRWAGIRIGSLVAWGSKSGQDSDAVSGATRLDHSMQITVTWDLKNRAGTIVPDGTYTIRMELADSNASQPAQNHQGTFTFAKGTAPDMQSTSGGGFTGVMINYAPIGANCNNGVVDPGETCDPPGSCPTTCAASADACMPNVLVGDAPTCTAQCTTQAITACVDGDGCCAAGCTDATDSDCAPGGGGGGGGNIEGGCAVGGASSPLWLAGLTLVGGVLLRRRRR